ncbi:MFS transporter [Kitasatospora sp. NPDC096147]|uniref:MFS transporter n=1 Tax=Kitasatospora sp. NPDC096147 TaxID=3364093 RepID=UPI0037F2572B
MSFRVWLSARFFLFFLTWSVYLSYWGVWLLDAGFDGTDVALIVTAGLLARSASVAFLYPLLCRIAPLGRLAQLLAWGSAATSLLYLAPAGLPSMVAVSVLVGLCYPLIMPLSETLATIGAQTGRADYGAVRYWGSAGFIAGLGLCGLLESAYGSPVLVWVFVGGCLLMALVGLVPPSGVELGPAPPARAAKRTLLGHRPYLLVLAVSVLLQGTHGIYYAFGAAYFGGLGVSHAGVSLLLGLAVAAELLLFKYALPLLGARSVPALFALAAVASVLRWGLLAAPLPVAVLVASQVLHAGTFALTHFAHAQAVRLHLPQNLWATAHGLYAAVAMSLGSAVMTAVAGPLYSGSPRLAFLVMAALCLPGLLLCRALAGALRGARPEPAAPVPATPTPAPTETTARMLD